MAAAQREIGSIYYQDGDIDLAKVWFGLAVRRENVTALNDLGVLHWNNKENELAIEYWQRASNLGEEIANENLRLANEESETANSPGQVKVSESSTKSRISIH